MEPCLMRIWRGHWTITQLRMPTPCTQGINRFRTMCFRWYDRPPTVNPSVLGMALRKA